MKRIYHNRIKMEKSNGCNGDQNEKNHTSAKESRNEKIEEISYEGNHEREGKLCARGAGVCLLKNECACGVRVFFVTGEPDRKQCDEAEERRCLGSRSYDTERWRRGKTSGRDGWEAQALHAERVITPPTMWIRIVFPQEVNNRGYSMGCK